MSVRIKSSENNASPGHTKYLENVENETKEPTSIKSRLAGFYSQRRTIFVSCYIQMTSYGFSFMEAELSSIISCFVQKFGRILDEFKAITHQRRHGIKCFLERNKELSLRIASNLETLKSELSRVVQQCFEILINN